MSYSQMAQLELMNALNNITSEAELKEFRDLAAAAGVTAREIWKVRDAMDHTSNAFKALIGYGQVWLTFGFAHTAQDFVKTAMQLENVEVAFKAIYGTSDMAQKKLEYVRQVSDELGLSFMDTAEGAKKLFAAAQGTPIEAEANMVFKAFSNMSAAMKLTGDETKAAAGRAHARRRQPVCTLHWRQHSGTGQDAAGWRRHAGAFPPVC